LPPVVVGAGAAGLVAAAFASEPGRPAILIERTADGGRKILISGGGRCNVLPAALEPERFITSSPPHLLRRMLRAWPLEHQRAFFEEELGIPLKFEAADRKYFPKSDRARDVRDALVAFARKRGVEIRFGTTLERLEPIGNGRWRLTTSGGGDAGLNQIEADAVVLATGGLSVPTTGSDGTGLRIAESLGHTVHPLYPALTPLVLEPPVHAGLSGVSLPVRIRAKRGNGIREIRGSFLFTHRGYSGPAVLDISSTPDAMRVSWGDIPQSEWETLLTSGTGLILNAVASRIPQRLAERLLFEAGVPLDRRFQDLRRTERISLIELLTAYPLNVSGDEGYKKAEVTGGGVALDEVDAATLESRRAPGHFLCGEMLDAFGPIGGHNFAWAWSTGRAAGLGARGTVPLSTGFPQ
jgi:predicted Rossmann fold flavoprotein